MARHFVCCDDPDHTLCGQHFTVIGPPDGSQCGMCKAVIDLRPLPCPKSGQDCKVVTSPALVEAEAEVQAEKIVASIDGLLYGKLSDPKPAFEDIYDWVDDIEKHSMQVPGGKDVYDYWVDGKYQDHETRIPRVSSFTDEELTHFIREHYKPSSTHWEGNYHCPCWRCSMLRRAGWMPQSPFPRDISHHLRSIRGENP